MYLCSWLDHPSLSYSPPLLLLSSHEDEVVHYDVKQETNYYISEEHRSPTLKDLIEHYKTSKGGEFLLHLHVDALVKISKRPEHII